MIYLDTSALAKLIWREPESDALQGFLAKWPQTPLVSSALLLVETRRAVLRVDASGMERADLLLTRIGKVGITSAVLEAASRMPDTHLRSLDAIHLATALLLRNDLDAVLTYDQRLATAAAAEGLPVESPSG